MKTYFINYNTGAGNQTIEVNSLREAKEIAQAGIAYTQQDVTILDKDGIEICRARWYGIKPEEDADILEEIGGGYYVPWDDEY